jgi:uncharacterized protein (DUF2062 family)
MGLETHDGILFLKKKTFNKKINYTANPNSILIIKATPHSL